MNSHKTDKAIKGIRSKIDPAFRYLPQDWSVVSLGECGIWKGGGTPSKDNRDYWQNGNIPWASSQDIVRRILEKTTYMISNLAVTQSTTNIIPGQSVVIVMRSGILRNSLPVAMTMANVAINQDLKAIIPNQAIRCEFLYYTILNESRKIRLSCVKSGTTVESVEFETLKAYKICFPPRDEQDTIVSILSTWDRAIELKEKLLEQKKLQKKGLTERLLTGKVRLPGFKDQWKAVRVSDVFERVTRKNRGKSTNVLTVSAQRGFIRQDEFFSKSVASDVLDNYCLLNQGEFVYNKSYSNGYPYGAIKRLNDHKEAVVTTLYICFKFKNDEHSSNFWEQFFEAGMLNAALTRITAEGARAHGLLNIAQNEFFDINVRIPPRREQDAISVLLVRFDEELTLIKTSIDTLKLQKKGLMQLLLTGKVRVPLEEEVP